MSHNSNNNSNTADECCEAALYDRWRTLCVDKLKDKLKLNIEKRRKNFEDVVSNAATKILRDNTLEIAPNFPKFRISSMIITEAVDRMCATIESWPGVHLSQCKKLPPIFKKYWRIADNWWNRQKGKWFGDLFFWPILHYNLHQYTKKILVHKNDSIQFDYAFYIFLCDILHSKVSFKKARPNPLIFDLALEKSPKLQQWFTTAGQQHGIIWEISSKTTKKSIKDYAQSWVKAVKDRKYTAYLHFQSVNSVHDAEIGKLLNVFPNVHSSSNSNSNSNNHTAMKRHSGSHKSNDSMSVPSSANNDYDIEKDTPDPPFAATQPNRSSTTSNNQKEDTSTSANTNVSAQQRSNSQQEYQRLMDECNALKVALHEQQQQQHMMAQALNEMQMHQMYKDQYIQQQQMAYMQQMHEAQLVANANANAMQQNPPSHMPPPTIKQEPSMHPYPYCYDAAANINQPELFLPQPPRYTQRNITPPPAIPQQRPLPPPLKTDAGKERRQSYHDVLNMKQYFKMMQQQNNDVKPESIHSLHTNHSTLTTASHTTVVSNMNAMPNNPHSLRQSTPTTQHSIGGTSTPSGSEASGRNKFFYNQYPAVSALPALHIYAPPQAHHYHLPPPVVPPFPQPQHQQPHPMMPMSPIPKQNNPLMPMPPPLNSSRRASSSQTQTHPAHLSMDGYQDSNSNHNSTMFGDSNSAANQATNGSEYGNLDAPFEQEMMDLSMNNLLAPMGGMGGMSGSNLSLSNSNNLIFDAMDTTFSTPNHMDMSISNCFVNCNSDQ